MGVIVGVVCGAGVSVAAGGSVSTMTGVAGISGEETTASAVGVASFDHGPNEYASQHPPQRMSRPNAPSTRSAMETIGFDFFGCPAFEIEVGEVLSL